MRRGLSLAPFGRLCDPRLVAELAAAAEAAGFDGVWVWDHIRYSPPELEVADPWVVLTAMALATERIRIGPLVTPLPRRRPAKLARETATLDLLSGGRLTFGAGLGSDGHGEFADFEAVVEPRERAALLDEGLAELERLWDAFRPRPVQTPRIPVWLAGRWPNKRPLRRALRFDGFAPIDLEGPDTLREIVALVEEERGTADGFDLVVMEPPGADPAPWAEAGATWLLTTFGKDPDPDAVRAAIDAGP